MPEPERPEITATTTTSLLDPPHQNLAPALEKAEETEISDISRLKKAPDGGLTAWLTVFASFTVHFLILGVVYSFGNYAAFYAANGLDSLSSITWIGSIGAAARVGFGLPSGRFAELYGFRTMMFCGTVILSGGLILASFCTNSTWKLMLTQGLLFGLGSSLVYFPAVSVPSQWFTTKRSMATGIAVSGSGIGGLVMALVIEKALTAFGPAWTLRMTGIAMFVGLCSILPLVKTRIPPAPKSKTDWSVFRDWNFLLLLLLTLFATFASFIPINFLPSFAINVVGSSPTEAAILVSVYNGAGAVGRIVIGIAADTVFGRVNSIVLCGFFSGMSMLFIWTFADTFLILVVFAIVNGFVAGGFIALFPVVLGHTYELERLPSLIGTILTFSALGNLCGSPLGGLIQSQFGYQWLAVFSGLVMMVSLVFSVTLRIKVDRKLWKIV
ncbi:hypothetical protein HK100_004545 [Physocladia obscura]|uniref:Major facilitator superfamily (MFS) profile domain-containing protein n=1 Tax=Physocladia obscura TaxID=109957 RepID=A0AAD5X9V2_9FUNG|nr:hypothetical protein HK100_004545 [Physocladia obscura]